MVWRCEWREACALFYRPSGVPPPQHKMWSERGLEMQRPCADIPTLSPSLAAPILTTNNLCHPSCSGDQARVGVTMIANLPAGEKQAFFSLLDEYFASRPHRLPASTPASQGGLTDRATAAAGNAAGAAASAAVSNALRDQFARTGLTKGPPPPAPSANKKPGFNVPAGLVSGKVSHPPCLQYYTSHADLHSLMRGERHWDRLI